MVLLSLAASALGSTGCKTAIKQAYYTAVGAQGKFYEVRTVDPDVLATYQCVRVDPFTNELGERVPPEVIAEVNDHTPKTIAKSGLFYPEGKTLLVEGKIIHFTGKSGLMGSVGSVIGGAEECVCRVRLLDGESRELVGEAVCWGVVKSAVRRGAGELGIGVGKGVSKWISRRLPEEVKEARKRGLEESEEEEEEDDDEEEEEAEGERDSPSLPDGSDA
jgi:hypothetical protein